MTLVTRPYLPNREKLEKYIDGIYERQWLTNNGPLVQELTQRLEKYLGVENLLLVSNGTLALQVAYRALDIHQHINGQLPQAITTPFSFVATASSLKWEGINPVFVDIDPETWCLNPYNIGSAVTSKTRAIVPVHVFGNPCNVEYMQEVANNYNLKIIYDAAHAFDVNYKGESILKYGDASILSLHATKLFHSIEGGAIIFKRKEDLEKAKKLINFGISSPDCIDELGINAKMGEFNAAMGLCVLDEIENIKQQRKNIWDYYSAQINNKIIRQKWAQSSNNNYAYAPILFEDESKLILAKERLQLSNINPRRYFYPSLNTLDCLGEEQKCTCLNSESISNRILCLPIYPGMETNVKSRVVSILNELYE